jgi:hypothetical protein
MEIILLPARIHRPFIQSHPEWIFVYSSDYMSKSFFGQACSAYGEPNAYPVPVIWKLCPSSGEKHFHDGLFKFFANMIDEKISLIPNDGRPILPFPKIGMGHADLQNRAPRLFAYLYEQLNKIKYKQIEIDYYGKRYPLYA